MNVGDPCWRSSDGVAVLELPWRVYLPDGTPRTDPRQWAEDPAVLAATGWQRSALTPEDVAALTPPPPPAIAASPSWESPAGWRLSMTPETVALLTGLYVLAARREQLGLAQTIAITDIEGARHELMFAEFDLLMLGYGAAVEAQHGAS